MTQTWKDSGVQNNTDILQNILFCVPKNKKTTEVWKDIRVSKNKIK